MNSSRQIQQALLKGALIAVGLTIVMGGLGLLFMDPTVAYLNIFLFVFSWLLISFAVYRTSILKVVVMVALFVATLVLDSYMEIPDNPVTLPLIIFLWLGTASVIMPAFFRKYQVAIFSVYGATLSYFFVFRTMPDYAENHRQYMGNLLLAPIPVWIALWTYDQWRWYRTLKADKANAELTLLKSQINPHFFFNTLNNLYGLVVEKSEKAPAVILKLSDMMRYTIYRGREELVPLQDEIDYLENYIELHKIRYQKKVEISFIQEVAADVEVAPLLFIILLENAIKHGVEKMRENAFIRMHLRAEEKQLWFTVENNFDPTIADGKKGIGLENLQQRLVHSYPDRHTLTVDKKASTYSVELKLIL